jgi:DNA-binding transcriptional LysR family regulator
VIDTLVPELITGELDLICVSLDFPNQSEVTKYPLFNIHHVLIANPDHPLANDQEVDPATIHTYPWMVLKSDYIGTARIFSFFAANGLQPPKIAFETTSIHSLLQGLKSGDHIAHIPAQMLPLAQSVGLQQIHLRQTIWETTAGYAHRTSAKLTDPIRVLMRLLDGKAQIL